MTLKCYYVITIRDVIKHSIESVMNFKDEITQLLNDQYEGYNTNMQIATCPVFLGYP